MIISYINGGLHTWLGPSGTSEAKVPTTHNSGLIAFCIFEKQATVRFAIHSYQMVQATTFEINNRAMLTSSSESCTLFVIAIR